ncbi:MAG: AAA family ATPase [Methanosarcinales archaeon]|jgi:CO dehydrogenase maturation factor|nr:AAA family ATPase [Methanosarcinales archaeon]
MRIIAVSGKGGVGKSLLSALIIRKLILDGENNILVIDADPDSNMPDMLGVEVESTVGDIKEELMSEQNDLPEGVNRSKWLESKIFETVEELDEFDLLVMGRPEGSGCYCAVNNVLRWVIDSMTKSYDYIIIDVEAGLEHISRKTTLGVDDMIIVTDMSSHGFNAAERIKKMTTDLGARFKHLYLVANRIHHSYEKEILAKSNSIGLEFIGLIPYDQQVEKYAFEGKSLLKLEECDATKAVGKIVEKIKEKSIEK